VLLILLDDIIRYRVIFISFGTNELPEAVRLKKAAERAAARRKLGAARSGQEHLDWSDGLLSPRAFSWVLGIITTSHLVSTFKLRGTMLSSFTSLP